MRTDRRILQAAAQAFYEKGFGGVGVDSIGERAGVRGPSIYRHFTGKDEILATLLNESLDELLTATEPVDADPDRDLARALRHHLEFALRHRQLVSIYQRERRSLAYPWRQPFQERRALYNAGWERLIAARLPQLEAPAVAAATQATLGMVFSLSDWPAGVRDSQDPSTTVELVTELLLNGLRGLTPRADRAGSV